MPANSPAVAQPLAAAPNREPLPENDPQEALPSQNKFFAIIYSCAFLLSVGNGFLSGKTSFIAVDWFAGAQCAGVKTDKCDPSIAFSCTCKTAVTQYALISGAFTFTSLAFAVFVVPFLCRASDSFGRRVFIQVGSVMSCWSISVFLYLITGLKWSLWLMFVLSFVASQSPASTVSVSSILDVCPTEDKSKVLGRRAALFVLGTCVGLGAGYFLSELQASIACFVCSLLSVAVHILFWPETLLKRHRVPFTRGASNPFRPLLFFFIKKSYRYLFIVMLTEQLAGAGFSALIFQYTRQAFNADTSLFSLALATFNLATAAMPGLLLPVWHMLPS
jgi:MFS family permease